jgi:phosphocarrier protein HPr
MTNERIERRVEIVSPLGFHARPAAEFVKLAGSFQSDLWLEKEGVEVNAKSIMGVLMLAAEMGSQLMIRGEGDDAEDAIVALASLIGRDFEEIHGV